jgi:hypothetical protein
MESAIYLPPSGISDSQATFAVRYWQIQIDYNFGKDHHLKK